MHVSLKDQAIPGESPLVTPVGKFPLWKRGMALLWVLSLCGLGALAGLFVTGFFGSMSGY